MYICKKKTYYLNFISNKYTEKKNYQDSIRSLQESRASRCWWQMADDLVKCVKSIMASQPSSARKLSSTTGNDLKKFLKSFHLR